MGTSYGAAQIASMFASCVLHASLSDCAAVSGGGYDVFPVIPSGVTATNAGTFTKTDLGNNQSVLNFDGSTNYISLTDNDAWTMLNGDCTFGGWIKFNSSINGQIILSQYIDSVNRWSFFSDSGLIGIFGIVTSSITFHYNITLSPTIGSWYHIVFVKSGSSYTIYVNGSPTSCTVGNAFTTHTNYAAPLTIGANYPGTAYCNINAKDLMIWKGRALTQPEIKLLMNRTHPLTGAGLLPSGDYFRLS